MSTEPIERSCLVKDGALHVRNRTRLLEQIGELSDGEYVLRIERRRATRSIEQNKYWWSVCVELVSEHTGYTPDEVHELAKQMFLPKKLAVSKGNGVIVGEAVLGGSTTKLNKVEFYDFVERYRQWAREDLGVVIPDPDPDWREKSDQEGRAA